MEGDKGSRRLEMLRQESKKLGPFLGKWNEETEIRKSNKAKQFEQCTAIW